MKARLLLVGTLGLTIALNSACAGAGKGKSSGGGSSYVSAVTGSIQTQTGDSTGFDGWLMVLMEKETGISRVGEIDNNGVYTFKNVSGGKVFTLLLLSPDFTISSVLAMVSGTKLGKVHQYFKLKGNTIPMVVHKGGNFEFSDPTAVSIQGDLANDADSNGIPDGMEADADSGDQLPENGNSSNNLVIHSIFNLTEADADEDGVINGKDSDIDGDGLANWFDPDDDGNNTYDVFSLDANSDGLLDSAQKVGDHYFGEELEYIAVQEIVEPLGNENLAFLKINVKLPSTAEKPTAVMIRGDSTLFDETQVVVKGTDGEEARDIWDRTLKDDSLSYDGAKGDRIYGRKIQLAAGLQPSANQVIFIQLVYGSGKSVWFKEFPFTFTGVATDAIEFSYSDGTITLETEAPFGQDAAGDDITNFVWSVTIYDEDGTIVDSSAPILGAETTYDVPSGKVDDGGSYTAKVFAQSLSKVTGFPVYLIESEEADLE